MATSTLLHKLQKAKSPHRKLDVPLGLLLGYQEKTVGEGEDKRTIFLDKNGVKAKMPFYTSNLDDAYTLASELMPGVPCALTWEGDTYRAQLWNGPRHEASNPALAVCIAVLDAYVGPAIGDH